VGKGGRLDNLPPKPLPCKGGRERKEKSLLFHREKGKGKKGGDGRSNEEVSKIVQLFKRREKGKKKRNSKALSLIFIKKGKEKGGKEGDERRSQRENNKFLHGALLW